MHSAAQTKNKIDHVTRAERELLAAIQHITKEDIAALTTDFFLKNPNIASITWDQYTPYFNDGYPCIFSVNTDYVRARYLPGEVPPDSEPTWGDDEYEITEENRALLLDFCRVPDDVFLHLFGDHSEVTISNLGDVTRAEFNHD